MGEIETMMDWNKSAADRPSDKINFAGKPCSSVDH
jgi:hypothetical protein